MSHSVAAGGVETWSDAEGFAGGPLVIIAVYSLRKMEVMESHSSRMEHANAVLSVWEDLDNASSPIRLLVLCP